MRQLGSLWRLGSLAPEWHKRVERDLAVQTKQDLQVHRFRRHSFRFAAAVILVPASLGYFAYLRWGTSQTPAPASKLTALGLRAERRANAVHVSWDPDTPIVNRAVYGVLSIHDGDLQPEPLRLTPAELRYGRIVYGPSSGSIKIQLEVMAPDNTKASETLLAEPAPEAGLVAAIRPANDSSSRNRALSSPPGRQRRAGIPESVLLVDPPAVPILQPEPSVLTEQSVGAKPKFAPLRPPEPQFPPAAPTFVAAHAIHESRPNLPATVRATVTSEVEVQIKVQVDESGRVARIDSVRSTGPASRALVHATEDAARLWTFSPAMRGGQPVPSETILSFRYHPKSVRN
jgi:Gram-negative bacterial TonB protein C-terminal